MPSATYHCCLSDQNFHVRRQVKQTKKESAFFFVCHVTRRNGCYCSNVTGLETIFLFSLNYCFNKARKVYQPSLKMQREKFLLYLRMPRLLPAIQNCDTVTLCQAPFLGTKKQYGFFAQMPTDPRALQWNNALFSHIYQELSQFFVQMCTKNVEKRFEDLARFRHSIPNTMFLRLVPSMESSLC